MHFDYVCEGGIGMSDPQARKAWKNVTYGSHNAGPEDALFSKLAVDPNSYYHARGDQQSDMGLTEKAMASMNSYLEQSDPFRLHTLPANTEMKSMGKATRSDSDAGRRVFEHPIEVTIENRVPGARIRYTMDGTEPTKDSPAYEGPIRLPEDDEADDEGLQDGSRLQPDVFDHLRYQVMPAHKTTLALEERDRLRRRF